MRRITKASPFKRSLLQLGGLLLLAILTWHLLHQPTAVPKDVYPYLSSIPSTAILQCREERLASPTIPWEDLLALHTTFPDDEAKPLIEQLRANISFENLNWSRITQDRVKAAKRHREILVTYTYYQPDKYHFPVIGNTWYEDSFGADREGGKRKHEGTDLFGKEGTPIISVCSGIVEQLGWNRLGGERVGVRGDDGNYYYYAHLHSISSALQKGKRIEGGEPVGTMGHTGDALTTPDHLHFGIELPNNQWINPYPFLAAWQALGKMR